MVNLDKNSIEPTPPSAPVAPSVQVTSRKSGIALAKKIAKGTGRVVVEVFNVGLEILDAIN